MILGIMDICFFILVDWLKVLVGNIVVFLSIVNFNVIGIMVIVILFI